MKRVQEQNIDYKIKRQKAKQQDLGCMFIKTDPVNEGFDFLRNLNEIFRKIKHLRK